MTDVSSPNAKPIIEYTWGKLMNSRAYNACSSMPRFGHKGILTERGSRKDSITGKTVRLVAAV